MTGKELVLPITFVASLMGSAVLISNSYGRNTQALFQVQSALGEIRSDLKEGEANYRTTIRAIAGLEARLAVIEKAADTQAAINVRTLAHLSRKGD